jgi:hypothetical protein
MDKKIGVYICEGCDIGKSLDLAALSKLAGSEKVQLSALAVRDEFEPLCIALRPLRETPAVCRDWKMPNRAVSGE